MGDKITDAVNSIAYRSYLNRGRLVYIAYPQLDCCKLLADAFLAEGFEVSIAVGATNLLRLAQLRRPDLVLLDLGMESAERDAAIQLLTFFRTQHLGISVFMLAAENPPAEAVVRCVKLGASEVFCDPFQPTAVTAAAVEIFRRDLRPVTDSAGHVSIAVRGFGSLSGREREILQHLLDGETNKEIGQELGLSYRTVEVHRRHIMEKVGARNTAELVRLALES